MISVIDPARTYRHQGHGRLVACCPRSSTIVL